ncbi:MAG: ArdC family protein [Dokdonella sp.]
MTTDNLASGVLDASLTRESSDQKTRERASTCSAQLLDRLWRLIEKTIEPPWLRPFVMLPGALEPHNPATHHQFAGQNRMMLLAHLWDRNLSDPRFLTYRQALQLSKDSGQAIAVRKGEQALTILRPCRVGSNAVSTGQIATEPASMTLGDLADLGLSGAGDAGGRVYLTAYSVFHASQIANMPPCASAVRAIRADGPSRLDAFIDASGLVPADFTHATPGVDHSSREVHYSELLRTWYSATGSRCREHRWRAVDIWADDDSPDVTVERACEEFRASLFATIGMTLVGMQPFLGPSVSGQVRVWRELAESTDVQKRFAAASLEVLPMIDALQDHLSLRLPSMQWWSRLSQDLDAGGAIDPETPYQTANNVLLLVPRPR